MSDEQYILTNALAIDMDWTDCLQSALPKNATNETCKNELYEVNYQHENYSAYIDPISGEETYPLLEFNDNIINAKATEIGASINNYDIICTFGEDNIRQFV